jgi:glutamate-1-semialdehyde aminotransferase
MNLFFTENTFYAHHARNDQEIIEKFHLAALNYGLFIAPRGLIALSTVLTDSLVNEAIERALLAMNDII